MFRLIFQTKSVLPTALSLVVFGKTLSLWVVFVQILLLL